MKTPIGILGTDRMRVRLAQMFAHAGQRVILGSRDIRRNEEARRSVLLRLSATPLATVA